MIILLLYCLLIQILLAILHTDALRQQLYHRVLLRAVVHHIHMMLSMAETLLSIMQIYISQQQPHMSRRHLQHELYYMVQKNYYSYYYVKNLQHPETNTVALVSENLGIK